MQATRLGASTAHRVLPPALPLHMYAPRRCTPLHTHAPRRCTRPQRREILGLPPGDTDPALDDMSDEEYVLVEEPPELVEARKKLAAFTARQNEEEPPGARAAV